MTSTQNLAVVELSRQNLARPLAAAEVKAHVNLIQEVLSAVMKDGTHYGTIPGTNKPTLYKAGAEQILVTFRLGIDPEVIDLTTADEIRYRVACHVFLQGTGQRIGTGVGEASTSEEKYRWRAAVCPEEFDETPEDRRRKKWAKGQKPYQIQQVRTNPADLANTVLKMAKKRAQIDATLTATAASDVFAQDLEDLPDEVRDAAADETPDQRRPPIQPPQRKSETRPANGAASPVAGSTTVRTHVAQIASKDGVGDKGPWTKFTISGSDRQAYGTFSQDHRNIAQAAKEAGREVEIVYVQTKYGRDIKAIAEVGAREPGSDDK